MLKRLHPTLRTGISSLALATVASAGDFTQRVEGASTSIDGAGAAITAVGNTLVVGNGLTIRATNLPANSLGYFLASDTPASIPQPDGSHGVLCLGGAVGRCIGPGQIRNAGQAGMFELRNDLTSPPQPGVQSLRSLARPGTWYRDTIVGTSTSNLTNGLSVTFV